MKFKDIKEALQALNVTIRKRDNEYRVNFCNGKEATAYYTDDLKDAYLTGMCMVKQGSFTIN